MKMTLETGSLMQRLLKAGNPRDSWQWYDERQGLDYVAKCQLSDDDVPELIELTRQWGDPEWIDFLDEHESDTEYETCQLLPVAAWRGLACLGAVESVPTLLEMLNMFAAEDDDWSLEDYPHVFAKLGSATIEPLKRFAAEETNHVEARITAINAVSEIAKTDNEAALEITSWLTELMEQAEQQPIEFNSTILVALLHLKVTSAAQAIERAFAEDRLDVGMAGDWNSVREELGVTELGLEMPKHPYNSMDEFRQNRGINVFSDRALFPGDELDEDAALAYYETAMQQFSDSIEGKEVAQRFGDVGWVWTFLELGINYLGVTVNNMSPIDAEEIAFEIIPRKVSTEPESAEPIVYELCKFWQFVQRSFRLPNAEMMVGIFNEQAVDRLTSALSDPSTFGMAKSMFMMGSEAGFDMTSQAGLNEFMMAYNSSLQFDRLERDNEPPLPAPKMSAAEKRAFNKQRKKKLAAKLKAKKRR